MSEKTVNIAWKLEKGNSEEQRIYRSTSIFSKHNLPEVYSVVDSDKRIFCDKEVEKGNTYYYRISNVYDDIEEVSDIVKIEIKED